MIALVTERGGATSHTAIIARQLGIPCVVGAAGVMELAAGTFVVVDGETGEIELGADPDEARTRVEESRRLREELAQLDGPGRDRSTALPIKLLANVADGSSAASGERRAGAGRRAVPHRALLPRPQGGADGRGAGRDLRAVLAPYADGRYVVVRTLDAGSDKPIAFATHEGEENPALGVRGLRLCFGNPGLMDRQLDGIAAAAESTGTETWVMAPMVATVAEAAEFAEKVRARGLKPGVMVEIPSAALLAHRMLEVVDFLSIGTNDLTQYTMAADRMATDLAHLTDPWQPAVLQLIAITAEAGKRGGQAGRGVRRGGGRPDARDARSSAWASRRCPWPRAPYAPSVPSSAASRWRRARRPPRPPSVLPTRWPPAPPCARCWATEPGATTPVPSPTTEEPMTSAVRPLPRGRFDLPEEAWAWNLRGAGEENMGKDGAPELTPVPWPDADHMLVRIDSVGLCFSDVKIMRQGGSHPKLYDRDLAAGPDPARARGEPHRHRGRRQPQGPLPRRPAAGGAARHLPGRQEHGLRLHHPRRADPVPPDGRGDARHR